MKETPQRLRSLAPPTRDKIFIWSAVVAGCGIMALLSMSFLQWSMAKTEHTNAMSLKKTLKYSV